MQVTNNLKTCANKLHEIIQTNHQTGNSNKISSEELNLQLK